MLQLASRVEPRHGVLGIDIAKSTVVIHDLLTGRSRTVANEAAALTDALRPLAQRALAVCEATGGHERRVLDIAFQLGLPVHRADPAKARAFIASHGGQAKTDKADARWLARLALERGPALVRWTPPDPERDRLAALVRHRQALIAQRTASKNRFGAPASEPVHDLLHAEIDFLNRQIKEIDQRIRAVQASPQTAADHAILTAIPGVGPVTASALIALLPELGQLTRRRIASLAGLAPHPRDTGLTSGRRTIRGGRQELKPILFMAALSAARSSPTLKPAYDAMIARGKPKRVALTAIARKLLTIANARIRDANNNAAKLN